MKNWVWGIIGSGATAVVVLVAQWAMGTFEKGIEASETEAIKKVVEEVVLSEDQIKAILDEKMKTADGKTYGQVMVQNREKLIELSTQVKTLTDAMNALTGD